MIAMKRHKDHICANHRLKRFAIAALVVLGWADWPLSVTAMMLIASIAIGDDRGA